MWMTQPKQSQRADMALTQNNVSDEGFCTLGAGGWMWSSFLPNRPEVLLGWCAHIPKVLTKGWEEPTIMRITKAEALLHFRSRCMACSHQVTQRLKSCLLIMVFSQYLQVFLQMHWWFWYTVQISQNYPLFQLSFTLTFLISDWCWREQIHHKMLFSVPKLSPFLAEISFVRR